MNPSVLTMNPSRMDIPQNSGSLVNYRPEHLPNQTRVRSQNMKKRQLDAQRATGLYYALRKKQNDNSSWFDSGIADGLTIIDQAKSQTRIHSRQNALQLTTNSFEGAKTRSQLLIDDAGQSSKERDTTILFSINRASMTASNLNKRSESNQIQKQNMVQQLKQQQFL